MTIRLDYVSGSTILPDGSFSISPSSLGKFFDEPHNWYRSYVLGEKTFDQTTSTILGTIVHFCAEEFITTGKVDKYEIYKYIFKNVYDDPDKLPFPDSETKTLTLLQSMSHPDIDIQYILEQYPIMGNALLTELKKYPRGMCTTEQLVSAEIIPGYYVAGSCDLRKTDHIFDYKTTSSLSAPSSVSYGYKLQLLAYAYALVKSGVPIKTASIIWVTTHQVNRFNEKGKPLADYPATCSLSSAITIDEQALSFIESILKLVAETVQFVKANPDKAYIVFRDYRLKFPELPQIPFAKATNVSS